MNSVPRSAIARALDRAAVGVDDPLCQRQAEAGTRWRALAGALAAIEPLEDMRQIAGVDADAGVGDSQDDAIVLEPDVNRDDAVWPVVRDAVVKETRDELAQPIRIAGDRLRGRR